MKTAYSIIDSCFPGGRDMERILLFCLFCWLSGGSFLLTSLFDGRFSHIRYLSESETGELISRLLVGCFGIVLIGIGLIVWLAPR